MRLTLFVPGSLFSAYGSAGFYKSTDANAAARKNSHFPIKN